MLQSSANLKATHNTTVGDPVPRHFRYILRPPPMLPVPEIPLPLEIACRFDNWNCIDHKPGLLHLDGVAAVRIVHASREKLRETILGGSPCWPRLRAPPAQSRIAVRVSTTTGSHVLAGAMQQIEAARVIGASSRWVRLASFGIR